jgi:hypothetical protein
MSQAVNILAATYNPGIGLKHSAGKAKFFVITNSRYDHIWDRRLSKEEFLLIIIIFNKINKNKIIQNPNGIIKGNNIFQ